MKLVFYSIYIYKIYKFFLPLAKFFFLKIFQFQLKDYVH